VTAALSVSHGVPLVFGGWVLVYTCRYLISIKEEGIVSGFWDYWYCNILKNTKRERIVTSY